MNRPSKTEARQWLREFCRQYYARAKLIDLEQASDTEIIIGLMNGEKIKTIDPKDEK